VEQRALKIPGSIEASANHPQSPHPDQRIPLSTHRVISSIPRADESRGDEAIAAHQPMNETKWVYPSEQQFYNAMRRKGWNGIDESTIPQVVYIHNAVNERTWNHVRRWERELHNNPNPRLVKFMGRPKDMSPRAFFNSYILWYEPPFDRHDWYVDSGDGKPPRRYVIDFYNGTSKTTRRSPFSSLLDWVKPQQQSPPLISKPSMFLDVRPALDSPRDLLNRLQMFFISEFPGVYHALRKSEPQTPTPSGSEKKSEEKSST
jgi:cytochrome c heme-lyase